MWVTLAFVHLNVDADRNVYKVASYMSIPATVTGILICLLVLLAFVPKRRWSAAPENSDRPEERTDVEAPPRRAEASCPPVRAKR